MEGKAIPPMFARSVSSVLVLPVGWHFIVSIFHILSWVFSFLSVIHKPTFEWHPHVATSRGELFSHLLAQPPFQSLPCTGVGLLQRLPSVPVAVLPTAPLRGWTVAFGERSLAPISAGTIQATNISNQLDEVSPLRHRDSLYASGSVNHPWELLCNLYIRGQISHGCVKLRCLFILLTFLCYSNPYYWAVLRLIKNHHTFWNNLVSPSSLKW